MKINVPRGMPLDLVRGQGPATARWRPTATAACFPRLGPRMAVLCYYQPVVAGWMTDITPAARRGLLTNSQPTGRIKAAIAVHVIAIACC